MTTAAAAVTGAPLLLSELLGVRGVFPFLRTLRGRGEMLSSHVSRLVRAEIGANGNAVLQGLGKAGILVSHERQVYLSSLGHKVFLLLTAINGADLREVVRELSHSYPALFPYELVTEGMTEDFIHNLYILPSFKRVYICSPWIHLRPNMLRKFSYALYKAQERQVGGKTEVLVIARPLEKKDPAYTVFRDTFRVLLRLGAEIVVHKKLHAKLYLREPGPAGGASMAIFGSENLTVKRNIELGIKIVNDTVLIRKLVNYFSELYVRCEPYKEEA